MSEDEAKTLLESCLRVLYYRDCRAWNKVGAKCVHTKGLRTKRN